MSKVELQYLCKGCMTYYPSIRRPCPICGFDETAPEFINQETLKLGSILNKRYCVGRVLEQNSNELTYIGWDIGLNSKIIIRECFSKYHCVRNNNVSNNVRLIAETANIFKNFITKFYTEAENLVLAGKLDGIVSINDAFVENSTSYIISDYIDYITLENYIDTSVQKVTLSHILSLLKPTIYSLAIIHQRGIVHKNITTKSLVVNTDGKLLLKDFCMQNETNYQYTYLNDLQDICKIFYHSITGTNYYNNLLTFDMTGSLYFPANIPDHVKSVIMSCLNKDPSCMCSSMFDLYTKIYATNEYANAIPLNGNLIDDINYNNNNNINNNNDYNSQQSTIVPLDLRPIRETILNLKRKDIISIFCVGFVAFALFFTCTIILDMNSTSNFLPDNKHTVSAAKETLHWKDKNFKKAVKKSLHISGEIGIKDLENVTTLSLSHYSISKIDDIKYFKSVTTLDLSDNLIDDISPLANLTSLSKLNISNNLIEDTSPIKNLPLKSANFTNNPVTNWSGTKNIKHLEKTKCNSSNSKKKNNNKTKGNK